MSKLTFLILFPTMTSPSVHPVWSVFCCVSLRGSIIYKLTKHSSSVSYFILLLSKFGFHFYCSSLFRTPYFNLKPNSEIACLFLVVLRRCVENGFSISRPHWNWYANVCKSGRCKASNSMLGKENNVFFLFLAILLILSISLGVVSRGEKKFHQKTNSSVRSRQWRMSNDEYSSLAFCFTRDFSLVFFY